MPVRRRVFVSGRVQGVFFRDSCRRLALELGVSGSAANLPDGRVEVELEGDPHAVLQLVAWCRHGPTRADVTKIEIIEEEPLGEIGFSIG